MVRNPLSVLVQVKTLQEHDFVGIVAFMPIKVYRNVLVRATEEEQDKMSSWIEENIQGEGWSQLPRHQNRENLDSSVCKTLFGTISSDREGRRHFLCGEFLRVMLVL